MERSAIARQAISHGDIVEWRAPDLPSHTNRRESRPDAPVTEDDAKASAARLAAYLKAIDL